MIHIRQEFIEQMDDQIQEHEGTDKGAWHEWQDGPRRDFTDPIYKHLSRLDAAILHKESYASDPKRAAQHAREVTKSAVAIANYAMKCAEVFGNES